MNQKVLAVLPSILFFLAAVLFLVINQNIALAICFFALGAGNLARVRARNKGDNINDGDQK